VKSMARSGQPSNRCSAPRISGNVGPSDKLLWLCAGAAPACLQDREGHACILVLPADQPSNRREALAVEALISEMLQVKAGVSALADHFTLANWILSMSKWRCIGLLGNMLI